MRGVGWLPTRPTLRGEEPDKPKPKLLEAPQSVDLLALRKLVIRQREGRLATKLPAVMAADGPARLMGPASGAEALDCR